MSRAKIRCFNANLCTSVSSQWYPSIRHAGRTSCPVMSTMSDSHWMVASAFHCLRFVAHATRADGSMLCSTSAIRLAKCISFVLRPPVLNHEVPEKLYAFHSLSLALHHPLIRPVRSAVPALANCMCHASRRRSGSSWRVRLFASSARARPIAETHDSRPSPPESLSPRSKSFGNEACTLILFNNHACACRSSFSILATGSRGLTTVSG